MKAPEKIETARLLLRRPVPGDAAAVYTRYASDEKVTRYIGWPRHRSISDSEKFLAWSDAAWERWPAGAYLIESREASQAPRLLGSTGFGFENVFEAATGYVLAQDAWGLGYATEALSAMVQLAPGLGVQRLSALCHPDNVASRRVLTKCGFRKEEGDCLHPFPNLDAGGPQPCLVYLRLFAE